MNQRSLFLSALAKELDVGFLLLLVLVFLGSAVGGLVGLLFVVAATVVLGPAYVLMAIYYKKSAYDGGGLVWRVRYQNGLCLECGYDLHANTSGVCPECGTPIDSGPAPHYTVVQELRQ